MSLPTNGFQDRPVMTTSVTLRIKDILPQNSVYNQALLCKLKSYKNKKGEKNYMVRVLVSIALTLLLLAGAAVTIVVFQELVGEPGMGIMELSYPIAWMVFFVGMAFYFIARIFTRRKMGLWILLVGLATSVFAIMFLVDMIDMTSGISGFIDRLQALWIPITISVVGLLTFLVGGSKMSKDN